MKDKRMTESARHTTQAANRSTSMMDFDLDVDRDLPRSWWAQGDDDGLPEDASAAEILSALWAGGAVAASRFETGCSGEVALGLSAALPERYLNTKEAATYLNVTPRYIRRLVEDGTVVVTKIGKYVRFTREDLDAVTERDGGVAVSVPRLRSVPNSDDPISRLLDGSLSVPTGRKQR